MSSDMDPQKAAEFATGGGGAESSTPLDGHVDVEGIGMAGEPEPGPETSRSLYDAMWNTEPNTSLSQIESPWNPQQGGIKRVFRGIQKAGDVDGLPAIADILLGLAEEYHRRDVSVPSRDTSDDEDDTGGMEIETVGDA